VSRIGSDVIAGILARCIIAAFIGAGIGVLGWAFWVLVGVAL